MSAVKIESENNFDLPDVVELDSTTSILLNEISENYDHTKYMGYNEALMNSTDYWHMVLVRKRCKHRLILL